MRWLSLGVLCVSLSLSGYAQRTLVHCGKLIDGKSRSAQSQMTLVIEGRMIVAVEKGYTIATTGDALIDLSQKTVLPGLIDLHVHLEGETNKDQALQRFTLNDADVALRSALFDRKTLMAGFTTVRDVGGSGVNVALRNAVNQGITEGPRIFTAGNAAHEHADAENRKDGEREGQSGDGD